MAVGVVADTGEKHPVDSACFYTLVANRVWLSEVDFRFVLAANMLAVLQLQSLLRCHGQFPDKRANLAAMPQLVKMPT